MTTTPPNHYVIMHTPTGTMRGTVIFAKRMGIGRMRLRVETREVLPYGEYEATYHTPSQESPGTFKVVTSHRPLS